MLALSFNWFKEFIASFWYIEEYKESQSEKTKIHSKGHASSVYNGWKMESGGAWRMTKLLGHTIPKKVTHVNYVYWYIITLHEIRGNKLVINRLPCQ